MGKLTGGAWFEARTPVTDPLKVFLCAAFLLGVSAAASAQAVNFKAAVTSGDAETQRTALFELKKIGSEEASRIALPALKNSDELVRATAASAVVWLPGDEAVAALLPLLNDESEFVRREAAYALGEVGDPAAIAPLLSMIDNSDSLESKNAAVIALGKIGDVAAIPKLLEILSKKPNDDNEFTRRSAARSLGRIAARSNGAEYDGTTPKNFLPLKYKEIDPKNDAQRKPQSFDNAVTVLIKVVQDPKESFDTRREAAAALGSIGDRRAVRAIDSCKKSTDIYLKEVCDEASLRLRQ